MVAGVNSLTTVLSASSPFVVQDGKQTSFAPKTEFTTLTIPRNTSALADIANAFSPPGKISLLAPAITSVLLTEQARQKPAILETTHAPVATGPSKSSQLLNELNSLPAVRSLPVASKPSFTTETHHTTAPGLKPKTDATKAAFQDTIKAFDTAQQLSAVPDSKAPQYATSTFNISV